MTNLFPTEWDLYEYLVDATIELQTSSNTSEIYDLMNFQVLGLMIEKNFDDDIFPIVLIDLLIPRSVYYKIIKNDDPKIILTVNKFVKQYDGITHKETVIQQKFTPIVTDDSNDINADVYKNLKASDDKKDDDITASDMNRAYQFILVLDDDIKKSKNTANIILSNVNVASTMMYMLSKSGFGSDNILMSPVDNTSTYDELLLLPTPIVDQFNYINNMYGVYKEGMQVFKDFDTFYILRKSGKCTAYRRNEPTTITFAVVGRIGSSSSVSRGINYDKANNRVFMSLSGNQLSISDTSSVIDKTTGINTQIIQVETGETIDVVGDSNTPTSTMTTISHSKYIKDEMLLRKKELSHIVNITIDDIDISLLTPNKEYKFITDVSDMRDTLSGTYRICNMRSLFRKEDTALKCMTVATFKRTSDN